jgi:hypothetical protein
MIRRILMTVTVIVPLAFATAVLAGPASATTYSATGTVTCSSVGGGIVFSPPLMLPSIGFAGPVADHGYVDIHLGGCTSTDSNVTFSGLNANTAIDGDATGVIPSHQNNVTGLAGSSTPFHLTVTWYGEGVGGVALAPTHVTVTGDMPYQGLVNDPGNIGFFLGTTTQTGSFLSAGPAGFQAFETTSGNDMPANSATNDCGQSGYDWPCMPSPGGSTSATVTPKAAASTTNVLCVAQSILGGYQYVKDIGQGWEIPGLSAAPDSGLLATLTGNLRLDPARGDGTNIVGTANPTMAGDYISAYSPSNVACSTQLGVAAGTLTLANPAGGALAKVNTSASPSAGTLTIGEPLSVSGIPASMGLLSTNTTTDSALCSPGPAPYKPVPGATTYAGDIITYQDGASPDSLCTLVDTGGYVIPAGVGRTAVWVFGSTANDIPPAATAPTLGVAVNGCTTASLTPFGTHPDTIIKQTGCNLVSAKGSFAATASSATLYGDATTGFATQAEVEGAATGAYNGYGGTANPDADGLSYIAIAATDSLTL